eukprot:352403_1
MKTQRPLSLLFTGSDGVGKQELAKQVANMLLYHHGCTRTRIDIDDSHVSQWRESSKSSRTRTSCTHTDCSNAILELRGIDYALDLKEGDLKEDAAEHKDEDADADSQNKGMNMNMNMTHRILNHIHAQDGAGAVIIITHGENLSKSATSDLVLLLGKSTVSFQKETLAKR